MATKNEKAGISTAHQQPIPRQHIYVLLPTLLCLHCASFCTPWHAQHNTDGRMRDWQRDTSATDPNEDPITSWLSNVVRKTSTLGSPLQCWLKLWWNQ